MEKLSSTRGNIFRVLATALCVLASLSMSSLVHAQVSAPPRPQSGYQNAAAFGLSYGVVNQRDADFWGWSAEVSRQLQGPWIGAVSVMWDRETEQLSGARSREVDSFTAAATITYAINERFALTTGLGKGFADTNNPSGSMRFASGDLATGIIIGFSTQGLRHLARDSISFSLAYEYNIDQEETMVSFDVGFGWSF